MGLKVCEECGENVDEAKAFCPDCGNPFVEEEKREGSSEFDDYAGTMNFSKSVYKMMLSEMDLDTTQRPSKEKQINRPTALNENVVSAIEPLKKSPIKKDLPKDKPAVKDKKQKKNNMMIFLAIGGVILLVFLLVVLAIFLYFLS